MSLTAHGDRLFYGGRRRPCGSRRAPAGLAAVVLLLLAAPALAQNRPPVADAGPDQSIFTNEGTILHGEATDPDNDTIEGWLWTVESQPPGSNPFLSNPESQDTSFTAYVPGEYIVSLIASDGLEWSEPDFVTITATDLLPPVAVATADVTIGLVPLTVQFDGSQSYDPQGGTLFYDWNFGDQTAGSNDISPVHTYVSAGNFTAILTVIDQQYGLSDQDTVQIQVGPPAECVMVDPVTLGWFNFNRPPVNTSVSQTFNVLNTCGATDIEIGAIFLQAGAHPDFSITSAPALPYTLSAGLSVGVEVTFAPTEPYYREATLEIQSDDSVRPEITIRMVSSPNREPLADAGPDQSIFTNEGTILHGEATDPDNDTIEGWLWTVESQPPGSNPFLSNPESQDTSFTAYVPGEYIVSLIASDGLEWSEPDFVTITATDLLPPVAVATADVTIGLVPLTVQFDGSQSYDPQGGTLFYDWNFGDQTAGSNDISPVHTYVSAGNFTAILTVIDQQYGLSDQDTVQIQVGPPAECVMVDPVTLGWFNFNRPPVNTSVSQTFNVLNTCGATDIEIGAIFLQAGAHPDFSITSAPALPYTLSAGLSVGVEVTFAPTEPYYREATLEIQSDDSVRPEITIRMVSSPNREPLADAGPDGPIFTRELVVLQGSATDPDNDTIVDWLWTVESSPPGSTPWLSDPTRPDAQFYADLPGDYLLSLIASDGLDWSRPDSVTLSATDAPPPPFRIESSVFNAGGHPDDGTILTSTAYRMTLDALGDATGSVGLGSASWRMEAGLTPGYRPPGEVQNLRFDDATTLRWDAEPTAVLYHLYDGDTCVPPALNQTMTTITATPPPGGLFTYLATAENTLGEEGTRGFKGDDSERPNPNPCP